MPFQAVPSATQATSVDDIQQNRGSDGHSAVRLFHVPLFDSLAPRQLLAVQVPLVSHQHVPQVLHTLHVPAAAKGHSGDSVIGKFPAVLEPTAKPRFLVQRGVRVCTRRHYTRRTVLHAQQLQRAAYQAAGHESCVAALS